MSADPMTPSDLLDETTEPREWTSLVERIARLGSMQGHKLPTKFQTLNEATRSGPRTGKVLIVGGAPGAGKTTFVTQIGTDYGVDGTHVAILACDEDADGLLIRVGQHFRLDRTAIEEGREQTAFSKIARGPLQKLLLIDADEQAVSIEEASAELAHRAGGKPSVLIVDSVQTARAVGTDEADGPRARVDAVMAALKRAAKVDGHLVIATCELARGSYRSKKTSEQIDDLAAFKESGGIEYGASLALVLRSVRGGSGDIVDVAMPKNRLGQRLSWRMELDRARASFKEVDAPPAEEEKDPIQEAKDCVRQVLRDAKEPITSKGDLKRRTHKRGTTAIAAIDEMLAEGDMTHDPSTGYKLVER